MNDHKTLLNLREFEGAAAARLPRMVFDYYAGGAGDEVTLGAASDAWDDLSIAIACCATVSQRDLSARVLGDDLGFPLLVAPMAFQRLAHPDGEIATMRAAAAAGRGDDPLDTRDKFD